jgi:two-component system, chemotaxis family, protein-glutamate methylesterase/glutaminase
MKTPHISGAPRHDIMVIGASAGGIGALKVLLEGLPPDLPAALFIVQHLAPEVTSYLPQILTRAGPLPAAHPQDGEPIRPGRIYVAPPDAHLTLGRGQVQVRKGTKEHGVRPAIDPLFRSAARAYGPRVVGVILSGLLDDGTAGLIAVKVEGGIAVVQDPAEAAFAAMPRHALRYLEVDYCRPLAEIPPVLVRLAQTPAATKESERTADMGEWTEALIQQQVTAVERGEVIDRPALASCPDCGGIIWRFQEGEFTQLQCREGHRYTAESFLARQGEALEQALWAVVRMLDERATCIRALAHHARAHQDHAGAATWEREAHEVQRKAEVLRQLLA